MFELNVPNALTVFRILLVPVLVAALLSGASSDALAAAVFVLASVTDVLDGWLDGVTTFEGDPGLPAVKEHIGVS